MKVTKIAALMLAGLVSTPAFAEEPGSGTYSKDCGSSDGGILISIYGDGLADVLGYDKAYENLDTSYSFFGNTTPSDFHVAILFEPGNSPLPDYEGSTGWIEIWEGENSYYALENGRASKELFFCK